MADIISRLKLESGEFDSKIKRAGQELLTYADHCKQTGLQMGFANKDAKEFAKALGDMQTTSRTARGQIGELSEAFVNLRVMYKNMTDEEKNNPFGQNLAASLDKLKTRIDAARQDLADVTKELNGVGESGAGGGKFDDMLSVFGGNLMTKGAEAVGQLVSQMGDLINEGVDLAVAGEGIRNAFERLDNPQLLDGLRQATHGTVTDLELMKAAVKFDDFKLPVEELGTMLAFAQQKAKDTGQSVDYMVDSIVTGLGRKSLMILDNLGLSATEVKEKMAETGDMTKAVGAIIREQMSKSGGYVETAADRAAQATVAQKNAMEALGRELMPLKQGADSAFAAIQTGALQATAFLVRNKEAVLAVTAAIGTYIAITKAHTAAIWLQQKAQLAFNAAAKINPYAAVAAAAVAAVTAIIAFTDKTKEATDTQKAMSAAAERTKKAQADAANTVSSSVGNVLASYQSLQTEWKTLKSEQEKNAFIKENADKFRDMGLAVNSAADAENVLVKNTAAVVNALKLRAEAEAWGEVYRERLKKKIENDANPSVENGRQVYSVLSPDNSGPYPARSRKEFLSQFSDEEKEYVRQQANGSEMLIEVFSRMSSKYDNEVVRLVREYRQKLAKGRKDAENQGIQEASDKMAETTVAARKAAAELSKLVPTTTKPTGGNGTKQQQTELQQNNALIEQLTQQYVKLSDAEKTAGDEQHLAITAQKAQLQSQIGMLQQRNAEIQRYTAQAKNTPAFALNAQGLPALNDQLKQLRQAQAEAASLDVWRTYEQQIANVENRIAELTGKLASGRQATITIPVAADTETLTKQLKAVADVTADDKTVTITADTQAALDKVLQLTDQVEGRTLTVKVVATTDATATKLTDTNLGAFTSDLKKQIANAELGSELYNQLTGRLADTTALSTVIQTALKNGVDLSTMSDQMQGVWQQLLGNVDVPDDAIRELVSKLNEQLAAADIDPITIDVKTGNIANAGKTVNQEWQKAASAVQQVGSALQQIEDPAAKVAGIIMTAIANVAMTFASSLKGTVTPWDWIAAAAAGTATMISTIASIKSATSGGFANGGIVPGNSFAGDNLRTSDYGINSGELILNRAQQGVIADALNSDNPSGNGGTGGQPYVMGETVYLGVNNHLRRNGQGELVTTSMLRKRGIL